MLEAMNEALQELEDEHGAEIKAGLNISDDATALAEEGFGEVGELRDFYRQEVLGNEGISSSYRSIMKHYKEVGFEKAIAFLIEAAGNDLHASSSSMSSAELTSIIDNLYFSQSLGNLHRMAGEDIAKVQKNFGEGKNASAHTIMEALLTCIEGKGRPGPIIAGLAAKCYIQSIVANIYFLTRMKEMFRLMPDKLFMDIVLRSRLRDEVQIYLDDYIAREDDEEDGDAEDGEQ